MPITKKSAKKSASPLQVGASVFIRTVTHNLTGRIVAITPHEIVLDEPAWIADSGRFGAALATGSLSEVEACPAPCSVGRGAIVDVHPWAHALPRTTR